MFSRARAAKTLATVWAEAGPTSVIAVAVKLDTPGPVFYRARRAGRGGAPFTLLKLRTMHAAAPGGSVITAATLMTSAPLLIAFLLFQRQFVQSFMRAGIK